MIVNVGLRRNVPFRRRPIHYLSLPGTAGNYASTPDSVASSITGDIDIRVKAALTDWSPSAGQCFVAKRVGAGQISYVFYQDTTGKLAFFGSTDGTASTWALVSSVAHGITDGATYFVRMTRVASTGVLKFYISSDGLAWDQLGTDVSSTVGNIYDSTSQVEIGTQLSGSSLPLNGKIYKAQIFNGINGDIAVDFDASRYNGGTTLVGSTGEVWTLQGTAAIV